MNNNNTNKNNIGTPDLYTLQYTIYTITVQSIILSLISRNSWIIIDNECSPYFDVNLIFTLPSKWATSDNQSCSDISYLYF